MIGKTYGSLNYTTRILCKILNEKAVTETELMNVVGRNGDAVGKIERAYKYFVTVGFPIKRRIIDQKFKHGTTHSSGGGGLVNHRTRIYYVV